MRTVFFDNNNWAKLVWKRGFSDVCTIELKTILSMYLFNLKLNHYQNS